MTDVRTTTDVNALPVSELGELLRKKEVSPVEVTKSYLDRISEYNHKVNAYVTVTEDEALTSARQAEKEIQRGDYRGPLHGVPIAHKDIYWTKGVRTTAGSRVLMDFVPEEDSTVVANYRAAGTIMLGKLNTHEFAYGSTNKPSAFGPPRNPWDPDRQTGGSSGGSAVATLMSMCGASTGSDSGGSIRMPSGACGTVGMKPTYGLGSRYGVIPLMWTMDHPGPITRTVRDAALMLQPVAGYDPKDPTTVQRSIPDYSAALTGDVKGLRVGVPTTYFYDRADPEVDATVRKAVEKLSELGAEVEEVELPYIEYAGAASLVLHLAEPPAYHDDTIASHPELFTDSIREQIRLGSYILAKDYLHAQRYRRLLGQSFATAFKEFDALVTPVLPIPATRSADEKVIVRGREEEVFFTMLRNTEPMDLTGLPALAVPCGFSVLGLPIGMQIVGKPFDEETVLRVGDAYEQATDWHKKLPALLDV